jgi:hypothetical protein
MIAQTIQLALAPVFVLVAIGNIMNILSIRLGARDRPSGAPAEAPRRDSGAEHDAVVREMRHPRPAHPLDRRGDPALVLSGVDDRLCVALLFVEELFKVNLQQVAAFGVLRRDRAADVARCGCFLREIRSATACAADSRELPRARAEALVPAPRQHLLPLLADRAFDDRLEEAERGRQVHVQHDLRCPRRRCGRAGPGPWRDVERHAVLARPPSLDLAPCRRG